MLNLHCILLSLVLFLSTPGCDAGGDDGGVAAGTFEVSISGAVSTDLRGQAAFGAGRDAQTGNQGFVINLQNGSQMVVLTLIDQPRPGAGSYPVARFGPGVDVDSIPDGQFVATVSVGSNVFASEGGTIRLSRSTTDEIVGEVDFTARSLLSAGEVTVRGQFSATGRDVGTL